MSRQKAKSERNHIPRRSDAAKPKGSLPLTVTRPELLNDDTEVTPGWAEAPLARFDNPLVGAVAPLVLRWPGLAGMSPRIDSAGDRYFIGGIAGKRYHGQLLNQVNLDPCRVFGASASSAFFRRSALLEVGLFPEEFEAYFEDVDLAFRLHWAGYRVVYEPAARVRHRVSASYGRPRRRLLEQQSHNEERVFWRNLPGRALGRGIERRGAGRARCGGPWGERGPDIKKQEAILKLRLPCP